MTTKQLEDGQKLIEQSIYELAKKLGLSNDKIEPITDGIYSAEKYLNSNPKIAWILKEPYDDKDKQGKPCGGGWSIPRECFDGDDAWKNRTWRLMIYSMYGFFNKLSWEDMDYIRDNKKMADILKQIAYINISKMPALTNSSQSPIGDYYKIWKQILFDQIKLYKPDILIFGNTIDYFWEDLFGQQDIQPIWEYKKDDICYLVAYKKDDMILLSVYHPQAHFSGFDSGEYVNSIIKAIKELY